MSFFNVRKPSPHPNVSRIFTLPDVAEPAKVGLALGQHLTDDTLARLCQPNDVFLGFLTRDVTATGARIGSTLEKDELFFNQSGALLETPFRSGAAVSVEKGDEVEVEGADYLLATGTGAINTSTIGGLTVGQTYINFEDGTARVAQGSERKEFVLSQKLTAEEAGQVRIVMTAV